MKSGVGNRFGHPVGEHVEQPVEGLVRMVGIARQTRRMIVAGVLLYACANDLRGGQGLGANVADDHAQVVAQSGELKVEVGAGRVFANATVENQPQNAATGLAGDLHEARLVRLEQGLARANLRVQRCAHHGQERADDQMKDLHNLQSLVGALVLLQVFTWLIGAVYYQSLKDDLRHERAVNWENFEAALSHMEER